jgi:tetratricopeptide (TPR) repeat protein
MDMFYTLKNRWQADRQSTPFLICAALVILLGGCATAPHDNSAADLPSQFRKVDAQLAKGERASAIEGLARIAGEHPTLTAPWLKTATIWFEAGNYPSAIVAATEVLKRDPQNEDARSLLVVAGLRVAAGAVTGLRRSSIVSSGVRTEAETLTNSLRGILGEKVLVPSPAAETRPPAQSGRARTRQPATSGGSAASAGGQADAANSNDPFKALK